MAIQLTEKNDGKTLEVRISGKLAHKDYQHFVPEFECLIKQSGKISVLAEMVDSLTPSEPSPKPNPKSSHRRK